MIQIYTGSNIISEELFIFCDGVLYHIGIKCYVTTLQADVHHWLQDSCSPFSLHGLILIPAYIYNFIHYKAWDEITCPFLNFNGATVEI